MTTMKEQTEKILLVDDDPLFLDSMANVLLSEKYNVDTSLSGMEALQRMSSGTYDLVIFDYNMQPINGIQLLKQIRSQHMDCAAIMITGFGNFEIASEALTYDVCTVLSKPVEMNRLLSSVEKCLQNLVFLRQGKVYEVQQAELEETNYRLNVAIKEFQAVFESITDPVMILDPDLKVIRANKATIEKLDLEPENVLGQACYNLFGGGDESLCEDCTSRRTLATGLPTQGSIKDTLRNQLYQVISYPVFDMDGKNIKSIVEFRRDITKVSEIEERIRQAEKITSQINLAAEVGHELNNLLTIINAHSSLVKAHAEEKNYEKAKESVLKMDEGIQRLVVYSSKLMKNHLEERNVTRVELISFLNSLINFVKPQPIFSSIKFHQFWEHRGITIEGDENQIHEIFINIFKNSAEAMKTGVISISGRLVEAGRKVRIQISDNGPGISEEIADKIFNETISTKKEGHGFGLVIVKKLVENNLGQIGFQSKAEQGTEITLTFPAVKSERNLS